MIYFEDWTLRVDGQVIAHQFDHLSRVLLVSGDIPTDWEWSMLVQIDEAMDILPLTFMQGGLGILLTAQQLSLFGYYKMQLRATRGDLVKHTNKIDVYIPSSISGDGQWPVVPSEFTDLERRAVEAVKKTENAAAVAENYAGQATAAGKHAEEAGAAAQDAAVAARQSAVHAAASEQVSAQHETAAQEARFLAESYTSHPPIVGENGTWWGWDGTRYTDSGKASQGELTKKQGNTYYVNALKGTASGTAIRVDDVSPLEHSVPVKVRSKNLVDLSKVRAYYTETVTVDGDTVKIAAGTQGFGFVLGGVVLELGKTYTFSFTSFAGFDFSTYKDYGFRIRYTDNTLSIMTGYTVQLAPATLTPKKEVSRVEFMIGFGDTIEQDIEVAGLQIEEGATATPYTPYVPDLTAATVRVQGKNLLPLDRAMFLTGTGTIEGDTITLHAAETMFGVNTNFSALRVGQTYTFSVVSVTDHTETWWGWYLHYADGTNSGMLGQNKTLTIPKQVSKICFYIGQAYTGNQDVQIKGLQIELGGSATEYEPYRDPAECTPAEDGTCEVTSSAPTMTLSTDTDGVLIDCEYNRDINKAFEQLTQAILSMGGNI